jgi:ABC-2 type transport system permease protein
MWLLLQLRLQRMSNQFAAMSRRTLSGTKSRAATPNKKNNRWLITVLVLFAMLFSYGQIARQSVLNLHCKLDNDSLCTTADASRINDRAMDIAATELVAEPFSNALVTGLTMELSLLFLVSFLMPLGTRELASPDWDLEWLVTMPVSRKGLLWGRLLERAIVNPTGLLALWPACSMIAWYSGYQWSAPVVAALGAFALLMLAALARTMVDTGLRLSLAPSKLRNLQAIASVISIPAMLGAMSFGMQTSSGFTFKWAREFPSWTIWTPPGLVVQALNSRDIVRTFMLMTLLTLTVAALLYVGVQILRYQLRNGVVAAGARESARRPSVAPSARTERHGLKFGSVVQRRELRLLSRDRNFMVQSLLMPMIMVGSQVMLNGQWSSVVEAATSPTAMASWAFGIGAYMLMLSAFQTLNTEGGALWLLYTFPCSIESILKEKAQLWAAIATAYPIAVFAIGIYFSHTVSWELVSLVVIVLVGVPIYSLIAVSLGIFACDPTAQDVQTRVRPTYVYLYMLLSGLYVYAIYASEWWQKLVSIVLTILLALALWQKARDELPCLLDPSASPAARVSTADGLMAAMIFFVLQGVSLILLNQGEHHLGITDIVISFSIAGALTYAMFRYTYWRTKTSGVPVIVNANSGSAVRWGLGLGTLAAMLGISYVFLLRHLDIGPESAQHLTDGWSNQVWFLGLAVVAAPLFEEFIFRGLIFGGLRRSMGALPAALASAAIFAIVHPPYSMLPVFALGLFAAFAYERKKVLLAPMLVHAIYNAAVVGYQLSL